MNFRKIVAHLAYSPAMIWHLAAYDAKIKHDRSNNLKIILFAVLNLLIIAMAISVNNNSHLSLNTPGLNTKPISTSLSRHLLINKDSQINNFSQNSFFNDINNNSELVRIYQHFNINNTSVTKMALAQSPVAPTSCVEINFSPLNNIGQITINRDLAVYAHNCQKQYYGLVINGHNGNNFTILNNGNLLLNNVALNTAQPLAFQINVVNSTTNTQSPLYINPGQSLKYTITATNTSQETLSDVVKINLSDIAEYAHILNNSLNSDQTIYWQINNLRPRQSLTYDIYIKTNHLFSSNPLNINSPTSHDCQLTLSIGNATNTVKASCSPLKQVELLTHQYLTPSRHDYKILISVLLFLLLIVMFKILHIARINFISKEIRIIRHNINQGII
jgi:conserved repeat protein